jgi:hypothetical protein
MLIVKDGVYREIDETRLAEYTEKGFAVADTPSKAKAEPAEKPDKVKA